MSRRKIVIANASGFWGDEAGALERQVQGGPIDYLTMDYLAEITMIILGRQKAADPGAGYAADFISSIKNSLKDIHDRGITVITNAGGMNPRACARVLGQVLREEGLYLPIAAIDGDDLMPSLPQLTEQGSLFPHVESGEPLGERLGLVESANAYIGARPIVEALSRGAKIVITGRCYDAASVVAPFIHEFDWGFEEYDKLASALLAGHLIECGTQSTGGNFTMWRQVPSFSNMGYPLVEASEDGSFVVTKHPGTGGMVTEQTVKEQLLYEIGDPTAYFSPDVIADFTTAVLEQEAKDRVRVHGLKGRCPTDRLKVSMNYRSGYKVSAMLVVSGPQPVTKGRVFAQMFWERVGVEGLAGVRTDYIGYSACWGESASPETEPNEIMLRFSARSEDRSRLERMSKEVAGLILAGPPGVTVFGGRPPVVPAYGYWPCFIERHRVSARIEMNSDVWSVPCDIGEWDTVKPVEPRETLNREMPLATRKVSLGRIAHARSGDKGDTVNIGVAALREELYPELLRVLTVDGVRRFFKDRPIGEIRRYRLDNLNAVNFVLLQALDGGGTESLLLDNQGKTLAQALLTMEVEVQPDLVVGD